MPNAAAAASPPEAEARLEPRVDTLEIRLTEQQAMLDDLNKVVLDQWREITDLKLMITRLEAQLADATAPGGVAPQDEPPPPHY